MKLRWPKRKEPFVEPTVPARLPDTNGWLPVVHPFYSGYWPGFDPAVIYEFARIDSNTTSHYRLSDQAEWFNVCGLYYRP